MPVFSQRYKCIKKSPRPILVVVILMFVVIIRAFILYILIIFSLRILGKRQIGELQPSELVTTILISNIAAIPIEDTNVPMLLSFAPIITIVFLELVISHIILKSRKLRLMVTGRPIVIIENGQLNQKAMKKLRFTIDDLMEGLRAKDVFDISDVYYAVVETNGQISVLLKFEAQTVTPKILELKGKQSPVPMVIISDGKLLYKNLKECNLGLLWLKNTIRENNYQMKDIFLMTADHNAGYLIIPKEKKQK